MIEFMLTHYVPPFAYLMVFVLDRGRQPPAGMLIYGAISIVWAFGWSVYFKT
jgi:hypothetical protein